MLIPYYCYLEYWKIRFALVSMRKQPSSDDMYAQVVEMHVPKMKKMKQGMH